jgi:hypothetical protein
LLEWDMFTKAFQVNPRLDYNSWRQDLVPNWHLHDGPIESWRSMFVTNSSGKWIQHVQTHHLSMGISLEPLFVNPNWFDVALPLLFQGNV